MKKLLTAFAISSLIACEKDKTEIKTEPQKPKIETVSDTSYVQNLTEDCLNSRVIKKTTTEDDEIISQVSDTTCIEPKPVDTIPNPPTDTIPTDTVPTPPPVSDTTIVTDTVFRENLTEDCLKSQIINKNQFTDGNFAKNISSDTTCLEPKIETPEFKTSDLIDYMENLEISDWNKIEENLKNLIPSPIYNKIIGIGGWENLNRAGNVLPQNWLIRNYVTTAPNRDEQIQVLSNLTFLYADDVQLLTGLQYELYKRITGGSYSDVHLVHANSGTIGQRGLTPMAINLSENFAKNPNEHWTREELISEWIKGLKNIPDEQFVGYTIEEEEALFNMLKSLNN